MVFASGGSPGLKEVGLPAQIAGWCESLRDIELCSSQAAD